MWRAALWSASQHAGCATARGAVCWLCLMTARVSCASWPVQVRTLGGDAAVQAIPLGPIPHPEEQRQQQQQQQQQGGSSSQAGGAIAAPPSASVAAGSSGGGSEDAQADGQQQLPPPQQQATQPQLEPLGDPVVAFDEISVAAGVLGRFPGSQVMPLIRQFIGLEMAA